MYNKAIKNIFQKIPTIISNHLVKDKTAENIDRNWGWAVYEKITKGILPLRRQKLTEKSQEKYD